jgi:hypothetical protein
MKLNTMSVREQVLVLAVAAVVIGGGYTLLRGWPAYTELKAMEDATAQTEARVKKAEIPELPDDDEEGLEWQIAKAESALQAVKTNAEAIERRLAPSDSQELKLRISSLAQQYGVLIHESKAFVAPNPMLRAAPAPTRKDRRAAKKAGTKATKPTAAPTGPAVVDANEPLTSRMAQGTALERPMQQMSMEGDYAAISQFILGLDRLPWQVTIVQFKLEARPSEPPTGYPHRLSARMILAL